MSNNYKPQLGLRGTSSQAPMPERLVREGGQLIPEFEKLLEEFPLPWCVGPYGDIWVAADVEQYDPEKESNTEKIRGPNGTWWRSTVPKPRMVMELPAGQNVAAFMVWAANKMVKTT